ncbi:DNA cytosine methyltransferase [Variovorax sp. IB41]|uniref:DNA cytosine methyltransferase n=1 Tax=Variovorax sp. IB41 TaxID=2779370 RepID=UPI0018E70CAF|nr:DNA cytosine methyltransferase [Variovorax sp. IB41]
MSDLCKVVDLYAGAGGFSLGAARAGFDLSASVEIDPFANETHQKNFPKARHLGVDVAELSGNDLLVHSGLKAGQLAGLIGGPPCQGFSDMGRRNPEDSRNSLFGHFMRLVHETRPAFFVAENVPGILDIRNEETVKAAYKLLPKDYVLLKPHRVCAADFGAPTTRTRVFFVGFDPKRCNELSSEIFVPPIKRELVTVGTALTGLPEEIDSAWQDESEGWREVQRVSSNTSSYFQRAQGHRPKNIGFDFAIDAFFEFGVTSGCLGTLHTPGVVKRFSSLKPKEVDKISKAMRLDVKGLCPTLRAGTGSDKGSYQAVRPIHPSQPRVITPREAARLQGFPDWFALHGTKWHSFRQLGNSVSPIVAEDVLSAIKKKLR